MLDTAIAFLWPDTAADLILQGDGVDARPPVGASGNVAEYRDGWGTTMTLSDDEFHGMCRALGCEHVSKDPRFATLAARQRNRPGLLEVLRGEMAEASRKLTLAEAAEKFAAEDVPFARARKLTELHEDPQIVHNQVFSTMEHPTAGTLRHARPAPRFGRTPVAPARPRRFQDNTHAKSSRRSVWEIASKTGSPAASSRRPSEHLLKSQALKIQESS